MWILFIGKELEFNFNCCKSKCMIIGPHKVSKILPMSINNAVMEWDDSIKYLGIVIKSDKLFNVDLKTHVVNSLFRSTA